MAQSQKEIDKLNFLLTEARQKIKDIHGTFKIISEAGMKASSDETHVPLFISRMSKIEEYFNSYETVQANIREISVKLSKLEDYEADMKVAFQIEDLYFLSLASLNKINALKTQSIPMSPAKDTTLNTSSAGLLVPGGHSITPKLPKLSIPTFNGVNLSEWPTYFDSFKSLIHRNANLTDIEKFYYLRSSLEGAALSVIKQIPLIGANYELAWNALLARYENKRILANAYFSNIISFKTPDGKQSLNSLQLFIDTFYENAAALKGMGIPDLADFFLVNLALRSLDHKTRTLFESQSSEIEFPKFEELIVFIKKQCRILEISNSSPQLSQQNKNVVYSSSKSKGGSSYKKVFLSTADSIVVCPHCSLDHKLPQCPIFLKMTPVDRHNLVKTLKRCFNCMGTHLISKCLSKRNCSVCHKKHHSSLHFDISNNMALKPSPLSQPSEPVSSPIVPTVSVLSASSVNSFKVQTPIVSSALLATAIVLIQDSCGTYQPVRLVIDSGSQLSFITESCVNRLNLPRRKYHVPVEGLGEALVSATKGVVSCKIKSRLPSQPELYSDAVILPKISSNLPSSPLSSEVLTMFKDKFLADPEFAYPGAIEFLLGADLWPHIFPNGKLEVLPGEPSSCLTIFGYIIMGKIPSSNIALKPVNSFFCANSLEDAVKRFWEIEEPTVMAPEYSPDELKCEEHFLKNHKRTKNGRYMVKLPFKINNPYFGDTRSTALSQFLRLENKLQKTPNLNGDYRDVIKDYLESGHMTKASASGSFVIPHHGVTRVSSSTTKLRIVFNASSTTKPCPSLNDVLYAGPKLQRDSTVIIMNFRIHATALCADIRQMYRQVLVHEDDRKYLHILWRDDPSQKIDEYELNTVPFGVKPSAYLAMRSIRQLVSDEGSDFSEASNVLLNDILVDDIVSGSSSIEKARVLKSQLVELLERGGFSLRKWLSNDPQLLEDIPASERVPLINISDDNKNTIKILGVGWDPASDYFIYNVSPLNIKFTKRGLLSMVAGLYDPMGWIAPVIFLTKVLIQKLWLSKFDWDDSLPPEDIVIWKDIIIQFASLASIKIPRFILFSETKNCQIIGFCDASEKGYGAVLYVRCENNCRKVKTNLIKAKTRVAPLKTMTIPRLELCAALLLSKIFKSALPLIEKLPVDRVFLFSDSTIVLNWICTSPHLLKIFVANRVVEILDNSAPSFWHHISSESNPADCSSRGLLPQDLVSHNLWWNGPDFLLSPINEWPIHEVENVSFSLLPEIKPISTTLLNTSESDFITWIETFSSFSRLQRTFAFLLRFNSNIRSKTSDRKNGHLSPIELEEALKRLIKLTQEKYFSSELKSLINNNPFKFAIKKLAPFIDSSGILRVGGRLQDSLLPNDSKHPILLPKHSHLTRLIIDYYHKCYLHVGPRTLQALLSRKFWIISARSIIRHRVRKCVVCFRFTSTPLEPYMANLPAARVRPSKPFYNVGCDFGGPLLIKEGRRRNAKTEKCYFCIFVCLATRAVHLEAVSDLSTPSFVASLDRFISRRGTCVEIMSDCGTNFVGASRHLKELYSFLRDHKNQNDVNNYLAPKNVIFKFNCPSAPHFNGISEAVIKSTKYHLRRILAERALTFEELSTVLSKIEAILNSRPLCQISNDPHETDCLTPGHFLVGGPMVSLPQTNFEYTPANRLKRWQLVQQLTQHFWRRWSTEYLHTLQERAKWTKKGDSIKVGDLVLMTEPRTSPTTWPTGKIEAVFPGKDGIIRVAEVRTKAGTYKRPLVKLVPVPKSD